jgi:hypothetical protein
VDPYRCHQSILSLYERLWKMPIETGEGMSTPARVPMCLALTAALTLVLAGCSAPAGGPRMRIGSLPFPGIVSLYEAADPDDLGVHRSGSGVIRFGTPSERQRGTLYTRCAGFLDLCHLRESIDWTRFMHRRIAEALREMERGEPPPRSFALRCFDADIKIEVHRPAWWTELASGEREDLIEELSLRAAERLAVCIVTWHEIATWYGYQTVPGVPEHWSAFTWDDTAAHIIGANIGGRVLRDRADDWDLAVTDALDSRLKELEVVSREEQARAIQLVRDRWWKGWSPIRRDLDVGLGRRFKVPWIVEELGTNAAVLSLPTLDDVHRRDLRGMIRLRITPSRGMMRKIMGSEDADPPRSLEGEAGLLEAVERVRASMRDEFGEGFDQP